MAKSHLTAASAALLALACASSAHAESWFQFEAGISGSDYMRGPDGLWVQDGFPHKVNLTGPAFEVGVTGDLYQAARWGISYHVDWAWLGTAHTDAMAVPNDADYNTATKGCNGPCLPLARFQGSGHDMGVLMTLEPHYDVGSWRFGIEAGPYIHHITWTETVSGDERWSLTNPMTFAVHSTSGWTVGYVLGASVSRGNFSLSYQYFANRGKASDPYPPIWQDTQMLMLKYRF